MKVINYKKLLPSTMRKNRWGQFIDVYQSIMEVDLKDNKINAIRDKIILDRMTQTDIENFAYRFGFDLTILTGYTETFEYLKREARTIILRIINKSTRKAYKYIFYIFNIVGDTYPMIKNFEGTELYPIEYWWESDENPIIVKTLDAGDDNLLYEVPYVFDTGMNQFDNGFTFDMTIPVYDSPKETGLPHITLDDDEYFPTLEPFSFLDLLTRHFLITYSFKFIENVDEFISEETCKAIYNDVNQVKRKIEVPYYEVQLPIETNDDNSLTTKTYYSYDQSITANMKSILIGSDLSDATTIQFGNSAHSIIDLTITGVNNLITSYTIADDFTIEDSSSIKLHIRKIISVLQKLFNFTEIAILDSGASCIYYATFPEVNWYSEMNANIYIKIDLV